MSAQTITLNQVKQAALLYYKEGKLFAQHPTNSMCIYSSQKHPGYRCAIGAALTDEVVELARVAGGTIYNLRVRQLIEVDDKEFDQLREIQRLHDAWCCAEGKTKEINERNFLATLE